MSTSTIKPPKTLKGIFSVPKVNHRRDFLRENKLSLREMERITIQKKEEERQQKQPYRGRSATQRDAPKGGGSRSVSQQRSLPSPSVSGSNVSGNFSNSRISARSARQVVSCDKEIQTEDIQDKEFLYDALKKCSSNNFEVLYETNAKNFESNSDVCLSAENNYKVKGKNDFGQQYLQDDESLMKNSKHNACIQGEPQYLEDEHYHGRSPMHSARLSDYDQQEIDDAINKFDHLSLNASYKEEPLSGRSRRSINDDLSLKLSARSCNKSYNAQHVSNDEQLSGRSRHTLLSNRLNNDLQIRKSVGNGTYTPREHHYNSNDMHGHDIRSKKSDQNLRRTNSKNRDDLRLPRYLEREKREKEEQIIRELGRDPYCPPGHVLLTEEERLAALAEAKKKYQTLIMELNRMPITSVTLRTRTRKLEIEKELAICDSDISIFSKPKVYVEKVHHDQ